MEFPLSSVKWNISETLTFVLQNTYTHTKIIYILLAVIQSTHSFL